MLMHGFSKCCAPVHTLKIRIQMGEYLTNFQKCIGFIFFLFFLFFFFIFFFSLISFDRTVLRGYSVYFYYKLLTGAEIAVSDWIHPVRSGLVLEYLA